MVFSIKVVTNARQNKVEKVGDGDFKAYITQKPEKGKANDRVIALLAEYLGVAKSRITISKGLREKNKLINISD